ncbi:MAG TPA: phosphate ABC transporter permease PstA [Rhodanobacter sp.]|jgi:phosphate transport system permease protein|nr:phosphate ABC transporter permease PstA [Rhodanobacter sp.]
MSARSLYTRRRITNAVALTFGAAATALGLFFLVWILWLTLVNGISALHGNLFTKITAYGPQGGLSNAFVGSLMMDVIALLICTPIGVMAGMWLAEYARLTKLGTVIRFLNDILLSAPSIVLGLFVYMIIVLPMSNMTHGAVSFSGFAGGVALALIGLPVIVRTTDEMLQLVPNTLREAALSLGVPQWKLTMQILLRAASSGIVTGVLLALARLAGETAPLLFTAFGNNFMTVHPLDKVASVPVAIYQYTNDPDPALHAIAWAGALVITLFVLALSLLTRLFFSGKKVSYG